MAIHRWASSTNHAVNRNSALNFFFFFPGDKKQFNHRQNLEERSSCNLALFGLATVN